MNAAAARTHRQRSKYRRCDAVSQPERLERLFRTFLDDQETGLLHSLFRKFADDADVDRSGAVSRGETLFTR